VSETKHHMSLSCGFIRWQYIATGHTLTHELWGRKSVWSESWRKSLHRRNTVRIGMALGKRRNKIGKIKLPLMLKIKKGKWKTSGKKSTSVDNYMYHLQVINFSHNVCLFSSYNFGYTYRLFSWNMLIVSFLLWRCTVCAESGLKDEIYLTDSFQRASERIGISCL
jgi:hypothetical protein